MTTGADQRRLARHGTCRVPPVNIQDKFSRSIIDHFKDPEILKCRVRKRIQSVAHMGGLQCDDMQRLVDALSEELDESDPRMFGDIERMFWRFEFSGTGIIREEEAVEMTLFILRRYRDALSPPSTSCAQLGVKNLSDKLIVGKKLGEGGQSVVRLAKYKSSGKEVVVKMYDKSIPNIPIDNITQEFNLLMSLRHPKIAHVFDIFQDASNVYILQEPYFGGDFTTAVAKASKAGVKVEEQWVSRVMQQVFAGVAFLHSRHVMHCDLKEANVMVANADDWTAPQVVVIDFGLADLFSTGPTLCGTPGYVPPEVWTDRLWTPRGDVFSLGVMMFKIRTGEDPFTEGCLKIDDVRHRTKTLNPEFKLPNGRPRMSRAMMALVSRMLEKDFKKRPGIMSLVDDPWFQTPDVGQRIDEEVLGKLMKGQEQARLYRALLADIASRENLAQLRNLNELFIELDCDKNGSISADEVRTVLGPRWEATQVDRLIECLLGDTGEEVNYDEFMGRLIAAREPEESWTLERLFNEVDLNGLGYLSRADIEQLMQRPAVRAVLGNRSAKEVMKEMDTNSDGKISFDEFKFAMRGDKKGHHQFSTLHTVAVWNVGDEAEYMSSTFDRWIPCKLIEVDRATGAVQVDVKAGYWLKGTQIRMKLRQPIRQRAPMRSKKKDPAIKFSRCMSCCRL